MSRSTSGYRLLDQEVSTEEEVETPEMIQLASIPRHIKYVPNRKFKQKFEFGDKKYANLYIGENRHC